VIRAVLFDLDGLMVDTEPIQFQAFRAMTKEYGIEIPESLMSEFVGYSEVDNIKVLQDEHSLPGTLEELVRKRRAHYLALLRTVPISVLPGFWELSREALRRCLKQAVVSSSTRDQVELPLHRIFESHPDTSDPHTYFDAIVCGDDVTHTKPAPDIYLLAAERLGVPPSECLAFEDTPPGLAAAVAAGMTVIAVPNEYTKELDFPGARATIESLKDASPYLDL